MKIIIVGNAELARGRGLGAEIDNFDRVCRFNRFKTKGFEQDVGTRITDHWCHQDCTDALRPGCHHFVCCAPHRLLWTWPHITELQIELSSQLFKHELKWCTTGFVAINYYVRKGFDVTITNFDFFRSHHYFGKLAGYDQNGLKFHDGEIERQHVMMLTDNGHVSVL